MLRVLLVLVAVLAAVLAFVFDRPWLYAGAAVPLVGALTLLARHVWTSSEEAASQAASAPPPDDSLEELGIMDVRPQERDGGTNGTSTPPQEEVSDEGPAQDASTDAGAAESGEEQSPQEARLDERRAERREAHAASVSSDSASSERSPVQSDDRPVLGPLLESLRAALDAQTVCLLVQEEVVLEYRIAALASAQTDVQRDGSFETNAPLLSASMSRRPVTVRRLDEEERADLSYYGTVPSITQVGVAPLDRPDTSATVFLLADATVEADLDTRQARSLLERYAETVGLILDAKEAEARRAPEPARTDGSGGAPDRDRDESETAQRENEARPRESGEAPRPRREIVAEEMEAADVASDPLALVLVLLNRYESVARQGEAAVDRAERHFRTRLEDLAPGQRVERFGELTYGIFVRRGVEAVEPWILDLQDAMARETGELEGGVSVGVAVRNPQHSPEQLREDATEALLEAYETGECAIKA